MAFLQSKKKPNSKNNGNGNGQEASPEILMARANTIEAKQTLSEIKNMLRGGNSAEEKTKFSIAEGLQDNEKVPHFTEYRNFDELQQMNQIEMYVELAPFVFGDSPRVKAVLDVFTKHVKQHKINMRSYERKGEKAIVDILRNDSGEIGKETSGWKKFTGVGR